MDTLKLDVMVYPSFLDPPRFVGDDLGPVGELLLWLLPEFLPLVTNLSSNCDLCITAPSHVEDHSTRSAASCCMHRLKHSCSLLQILLCQRLCQLIVVSMLSMSHGSHLSNDSGSLSDQAYMVHGRGEVSTMAASRPRVGSCNLNL